jgi:hypothetical protein
MNGARLQPEEILLPRRIHAIQKSAAAPHVFPLKKNLSLALYQGTALAVPQSAARNGGF